MAIKHRILTRSYKRKVTKFTKNKQTYKKFIGIQTLALDRPEKKDLPKLAVKKPRRKPKKLFYLKPYILNRLSSKSLEQEHLFAQKDRIRFQDFIAPRSSENLKEVKNFKAFLPRAVWEKMSHTARQAHLKKRRELQAKGLILKGRDKKNRSKFSKNVVRFSSRSSRPLLKLLKLKERREYLKSLVIMARFVVHNTVLDKRKVKRLDILKPAMNRKQLLGFNLLHLKKSLKLCKLKAASKKIKLVSLDYRSLVPQRIKYKKPAIQAATKNFPKRKSYNATKRS